MTLRIPSRSLTKRQHEVLALMLQGLNHRQIATEMGVATLTIWKHIVDIWDRLIEPCNREYANLLLAAVCERPDNSREGPIMFMHLRIGQRFRDQGQHYQRVDRARDGAGAYNAINAAGKRFLFLEHTIVEAIANE